MDVFRLRNHVISEYSDYVTSFINIQDPELRRYVEEKLAQGVLWPEPLLQLNPSFAPGPLVDELVESDQLHPGCGGAFRIRSAGGASRPLRLHQHQADAITAAQSGESYVLTTGTGSGKSLAYILPIVDRVLRTGSDRGIQAIIVYPMNALANSQEIELRKFLWPEHPEGRPPVTFRCYTGQESQEERDEIKLNPPDILLTNYVMLELLLTRPSDKAIIEAAQGLRFLVLDELHTYRGRQGADVAMLVRRVREACQMGAGSEIAALLRAGVVVHHGGLPQQLRVRLEALVRAGGVRLVIATTTLSHGVNLPIKTVLVYSLQQGYGQYVDPGTFWNICGRAGRGTQETEGQVLFGVDLTLEPTRVSGERSRRRELVASFGRYTVQSALRWFLRRVVDQWRTLHPQTDIQALCEFLAERALPKLVSEHERDPLSGWWARVDAEVLALTEEHGEAEISPDEFQDAFTGSLCFLQLTDEAHRGLTPDAASAILYARYRSIRARHPSPGTRRRFYRMGLRLDDCEWVEQNAEGITSSLLEAEAYGTWGPQERCQHLATLTSQLLGLRDVAPHEQPPDAWPRVLTLWLQGMCPGDILSDAQVEGLFPSPAECSEFIEDFFGYRVPWGLNAVISSLSDIATENGVELPSVCRYYAALVRNGVHDPVAVCLLSAGVWPRRLALRVAQSFPVAFTDPATVTMWLSQLSDEDLGAAAEDSDELAVLTGARSRAQELLDPRPARPRRTVIRLRAQGPPLDLAVGDRLVIQPRGADDEQRYSVYTLRGELVGRYRRETGIPAVWRDPEAVDVRVDDLTEEAKERHLRVSIAGI